MIIIPAHELDVYKYEGTYRFTDFKTVDDGLMIGDKVSYESNKFFLLDEEGQHEGRPSNALIRNCMCVGNRREVG